MGENPSLGHALSRLEPGPLPLFASKVKRAFTRMHPSHDVFCGIQLKTRQASDNGQKPLKPGIGTDLFSKVAIVAGIFASETGS